MPRQIVLASRPSGWPVEDNFALTEADRPDLADGQVRVRNLFMSVDPYMRGRMNDVKSYVPPFRLGEPLEGGAIGTVTESRSPDLAKGDLVLHMLGWRDEAVLPARQARKVAVAHGLSPSVYLGVLGMPTLTAYVGLLDIADAQARRGGLRLRRGGGGGQHGRPDRQAQGRRAGDRQRGHRREGPLAARDRVRRRVQLPVRLRRRPAAPGRAGRHRRLLRQRRRRPPGRRPGHAEQPRPGRHVRRDRPLQRHRAARRARATSAWSSASGSPCAASSSSITSTGRPT